MKVFKGGGASSIVILGGSVWKVDSNGRAELVLPTTQTRAAPADTNSLGISSDGSATVQISTNGEALQLEANGGQILYLNYTSGGSIDIQTTKILIAAGKFTKYNNTALAALGLPIIVASTSQKAEVAADANVLTYIPPTTAGSYRLRIVVSVSAATAAVLGWTATWKDSNGNAQAPTNLNIDQTGVASFALTETLNAAGNLEGSANIDIDNTGTAIVIKLTFSGTSFAAKVTATVEQLV